MPLFSLHLYAQDTSRTDYTASGTVFLGNTHNGGLDYYRNLILEDISNAGEIDPLNGGIKCSYTVDFGSFRYRPGLYEIHVHPVTAEVSALTYRGFDISTALVPDRANIMIRLTNQLGLVTDSLALTSVQVNKSPEYYVVRKVSSQQKEIFKLELGRVNFSYSVDAYQVFRDRIQVIDNYYAAVVMIDRLMESTSENSGFQELPLYSKIVLYTALINLKDFINSYHFEINPGLVTDPASLTSKMTELDRRILRIRTLVKREINRVDYPVEEWISDSRAYDKSLLNYLDLSESIDHRYNLFVRKMAELPSGDREELHYIMAFRDLTGNPDPDKGDLNRIYQAVGTGLMDIADSCMLSGKLPQATLFYKNASFVAGFIPGSHFGNIAEEKANETVATLRKYYLEISARALVRKNPEIAENYFLEAYGEKSLFGWKVPDSTGDSIRQAIKKLYLSRAFGLADNYNFDKAFEYMDKLSKAIPPVRTPGDTNCLSNKLLKLRQEIYRKKLEYALMKFQQGDLQEAEKMMNEAIDFRLFNPYEIPKEPIEIKVVGKINSFRCRQYIDEGKRNFRLGKYRISLFYFEKARNIAPPFFNVDETDTLLKRSARPVITELLDRANTKASGYFVEDGLKALAEANGMIEAYGLQGDSYLRARIDLLKVRLEDLKCELALKKYKDLVDKASEYIHSEEYISASLSVENAIQVSLDHSACGISDSAAWLMKVKTDVLADFERLENKAKAWIGEDNRIFIENYNDAGNFFKQNNLQQYGAHFYTLHQFVLHQSDSSLLRYMFRLYLDRQDNDKALDIMHRQAVIGNLGPADALLQQQLAIRLALKDMRNGKGVKPQVLMKQYAPDRKLYHPFRKAYKKTWLKGQGFKVRYLYLILM